MTPEQAATNYADAYAAYFGIPAPDISKQRDGKLSVIFRDGRDLSPKLYTANELIRLTRLYQKED